MQLIGMAVGIALGRLLDTTDYGMIAMISVFSLVANELQNSGFKAALNNLKQPEHSDYNSVFWFNIGMGLALYALLFLSAPLIAHYYHTPQLVPLCRYAFLSLIFSSFGTALFGQAHHGQAGGQSQSHQHHRVESHGRVHGLEGIRLLVVGHPNQPLRAAQHAALLALLTLATHIPDRFRPC